MNTNSWDPVWEKIFNEQEWGKYPSESLIQFVARNFYKSERPKIKILEVGCGTGANIWYISREGFDVYGIDGSVTAVEKARERIENEKLKAELIIGDIVKLPYENSFFDVVIDNECLYANTLDSTLSIIKEISRVLKPEGKFYSRTFSDKMYIGKSQKSIAYNEFTNISDGPLANKGFVRLTSEKDIEIIYGSAFEVLSVDTLKHTSYNRSLFTSEWVIVCKNKVQILVNE